jgi:hypothetical protein
MARSRAAGALQAAAGGKLRAGAITALMYIVDGVFADQIEAMDGFEA